MKSPIQIVLLSRQRWSWYSLSGGFWAVMLGRIELRLRWPMAPRCWVRERG